ncbi:hypothetical protein [Streptomyces sp. KR80]|uniref:hypothetical protein n=1 Tax=Streptomyces sp. KR80 TaxID=3457426 RepID=UPI003FD1D50C
MLTILILRLAGSGLTAAMAAIHLHLWNDGYRNLDTIGELFLLNGVVGGLLALVLLIAPGRSLGVTAALGALFTAGTLGALLLALTSGIFGWRETVDAPWVTTTIGVESAGTVVLTTLALLSVLGPSRGPHPGERRVRPSVHLRTPPR